MTLTEPNPLSNLTKEGLEQALTRYYVDRLPDKELMDMYHLPSTSGHRFFVTYLPPLVTEKTCDVCGAPLIFPYSSRGKWYDAVSSLPELYEKRKGNYICSNCGHHPFAKACSCRHCQDQRKQEALRRAEDHAAAVSGKVQEKFLFQPSRAPSLHSLKNIDDILPVLALLSLCKRRRGAVARGKACLYTLPPLSGILMLHRIFPLKRDTEAFLKTIFPSFFSINPNEHMEAFNVNKRGALSFDAQNVSWIANVAELLAGEHLEKLGSSVGKDFLRNYPTAVFRFWKKLSRKETLERFLAHLPYELDGDTHLPRELYVRIRKLKTTLTLQQFNYIFFRAGYYKRYFASCLNAKDEAVLSDIVRQAEELVASGEQDNEAMRRSFCWRKGERSLVSKAFFQWVLPLSEEESTQISPSLDFVMDLRDSVCPLSVSVGSAPKGT